MAKMFLINRENGKFVLRESYRSMDRNNNVADIAFSLEPKFGEKITLHQREELGALFSFQVFLPEEWELIRENCSQETVINLVHAEVQACKTEMRQPEKYTEIVNFLLAHPYEIVGIPEVTA